MKALQSLTQHSTTLQWDLYNISQSYDQISPLQLTKCPNLCKILGNHIGFVVKRILRYLKFSSDHTFFIFKSSSRHLVAFSESDWAGCPDDRHSTSSYCTFLGRNLLSWNSKRQPTVSRSSIESKYKALANASA
jgi:hypothetical protein